MANLSNINNKFLVTTGGNVLIGQTSAVGSSILQVTGTMTADTVDGTVITDGFITMGFAQLNRYGAAIELQYTPTNAATLVKIGANGSNPTIFNAYTGDATFAGSLTAQGIGATSLTTPLVQLQGNITILNKAQTSYISFATRDTSGSDTIMDLTNVTINGGDPGPYLPLSGGTMDSGAVITFTVPSAGGNFININHTGNENWSFGAQSGTGVDDYIDIGINGGTRTMSWHEDGNVGIGTSLPSYKLHIAGEAGIELFNSSGGGDVLNFRPSLGDAQKYNMSISSYDHSGSGTGAADGLSINGKDGVSIATGTDTTRTERMRITSAGNVKLTDEKILGLRTSTNDYALQYRDLDFRLIGSADGTTQRKFSFGYYTSDNPAGTWNGKTYINSYTGNVGIGVDPSSPLTIKSNSTSTASSGLIIQANSSTNSIVRLGERSNGRARLEMLDSGVTKIAFYTDGNNNYINAGNVGIGTTLPKAKLDVNGGFCVDSKAHTLTNAFTTCLTVNLNSHTGCYVTLTCFGDWGSHSSAAYRGEFFLQNGANAYAEPGIILRQDDNTSNGTDQIVCQIVDPAGSGNPKDFEIQIRTTATTGTTSFTGQLTYTVQGQFNSIT